MNTNKTLEELENRIWHSPPVDSSANVMRCVGLRSKKLRDYTADDIRFMICQNIGLKFMIPLAIQKLSNNILLKSRYYDGDLLKSTLTIDNTFWQNNVSLLHKMIAIITEKKSRIESQPEDDFNIKNTLIQVCDTFMERSLSYSY